ncbi:hypothetical protein GFS24_15980 [Chitinophaga sp. SYP-B3965]|uniref:hypothetical protein n=1 Tax=Chitinophaga sp. SYP-B3965 TaxID=2663120 RepID=UPI001299C1BE|nr:hypothetical protein [Chitinophaga sp. SYP-B3965]MRG46623.1 hypothetical protein [Chitinophaga sp. SYP-B3965]
MALINENLLVRGASGNVGKQFVYRRRGNNTHIVKMPSIKKGAVATTEQLEARDRFADAVLYAQGAISSAELKKEYQKTAPPGKTAYNMAFRDYLKAPVVKKIDASKYNRTPGSTIVVHAKDDFRVASVKVSIFNNQGNLLEEGEALINPVKRGQWVYTVTQADTELTAAVIRAKATDLPGNEGSLDISV